MGVLSRESIEGMGFAGLGENVSISDKASFYGCAHISLGNNVRIDDFCVLSAGAKGIIVGQYVHLAVYSSFIGKGKIEISDFCNISSRVAIYSSNDDYTGVYMTNPTVPIEYTGVTHADVFLAKHVIVGSGSVVLPGVILGEGVAVGALSLVNRNCEPFGVYAGNPARRIKERRREFLDFEKLVTAGRK